MLGLFSNELRIRNAGLEQGNAPRVNPSGPSVARRPAVTADVGPFSSNVTEYALQFPTMFPIKIMGRRADNFAQTIVEVVQRYAPDFDAATLEMRASREGNYLSLTATIHATSRVQLDDLYRELSSHPMVAMVF